MKRGKLAAFLLALAAVPGLQALCAAQAVVANTQGAPQAAQQPVTEPKIAISPGDILSVQVFETPELSADSVRVGENGQINLPVLGLVQVEGLNPIQAAVRIESDLRARGLMLEPHVTVSVIEFASQMATVLGEVRAPGVYPVYGGRRLLDVIALAGGLAPSAGKIVTITHRSDPHHVEIVRLAQNAQSLGSQKNPVILPDDTIDIGRAGIIYILGDVAKPGGYLIDNNERVSLIKALALAGGWKKEAALSKARLIRKVPRGHEQMIIDLKHVIQGRQRDIAIQNGDILFVPSSIGKILAYQGMSAAVLAAEQTVVYGSLNGTF